MTRPHKCRRIGSGPTANAFKPHGIPMRQLETVELRLDEWEAIRLADLEGLYQDEAAARIKVSRATFGRLIEAARHKVADALVNGKILIFAGGHVTMERQRTFACDECRVEFEAPFGTGRPTACPSCESRRLHRKPAKDAGTTDVGRTGKCGGRQRGRRRGQRCRRHGLAANATQQANRNENPPTGQHSG